MSIASVPARATAQARGASWAGFDIKSFQASRRLRSLTSRQVQRAFEGDLGNSVPVSMYRTWGASWELVGVPIPPLDFTLTDINGSTVIARWAGPPRDYAWQLT